MAANRTTPGPRSQTAAAATTVVLVTGLAAAIAAGAAWASDPAAVPNELKLQTCYTESQIAGYLRNHIRIASGDRVTVDSRRDLSDGKSALALVHQDLYARPDGNDWKLISHTDDPSCPRTLDLDGDNLRVKDYRFPVEPIAVPLQDYVEASNRATFNQVPVIEHPADEVVAGICRELGDTPDNASCGSHLGVLNFQSGRGYNVAIDAVSYIRDDDGRVTHQSITNFIVGPDGGYAIYDRGLHNGVTTDGGSGESWTFSREIRRAIEAARK